MKYVEKDKDIKLIENEGRRNYLVLNPSYHTTKPFSEKMLAIEMKKKQIFMNEFAYLDL